MAVSPESDLWTTGPRTGLAADQSLRFTIKSLVKAFMVRHALGCANTWKFTRMPIPRFG